jgi:hypothetical protein
MVGFWGWLRMGVSDQLGLSISILKHLTPPKGGDFGSLNIYSVHGGQSLIWVPVQLRNSLSLFFTISILIDARGPFGLSSLAEIDNEQPGREVVEMTSGLSAGRIKREA